MVAINGAPRTVRKNTQGRHLLTNQPQEISACSSFTSDAMENALTKNMFGKTGLV